MLNVSPNNHYWGGSKGVAQLYINSIGRTGMKPLPGPPSFRILNKAVDPLAQQIEAKYPNGFILTHFQRKNKNGNPFGPWLAMFTRGVKSDLTTLKNDPGYIQEAINILGNDCQRVNQTSALLLALLIKNKLI
jgi:hypothetical protein